MQLSEQLAILLMWLASVFARRKDNRTGNAEKPFPLRTLECVCLCVCVGGHRSLHTCVLNRMTKV